MAQAEDYFPRGGTKPKVSEVPQFKKKEENLFGVSHATKKSKGKKQREAKQAQRKEQNENAAQPHSLCADVLSYNKIQDGMLILGCVRKIKTLSVEIELPGRTYGELLIKHVTKTYFDELNRKLSEDYVDNDLTNLDKILKVGQFLPTRILRIEETEKGNKVSLSTDPKDVNSFLPRTVIKNDMLLWGAVIEKSDHCYFIDVGINNCRCVLPLKHTDESYEIGQPLYMVVIKSEHQPEASTITVSASREIIEGNTQEGDLSLDHLIPGMQVEYTIEKLLKDGTEGTFFENCLGYVNELYLSNPFDTSARYHPQQVIKARVMYTQPVTKFTYLTLHPFDANPELSLKIGTNAKSKVIAKAGAGLIVRINKQEKGFVSHKRILKTIKDGEKSVEKIFETKYGIGTEHACRVLDYNRLDRMYICTFEQQVIKEKLFGRESLAPGQIVQGFIKSINDHGILIRFGNLEGFVNNLHLSNSEYSENIKRKFKDGQKISAKVWFIDPQSGGIKLTLKPDLMSSDSVLSSYESADTNVEYSGIVATKTKKGILIVFYGNVKGWLPTGNIPQLGDGDCRNMFYAGQVVKCSVAHRDGDRLTLTLEAVKSKNSHRLIVGRCVRKSTVVDVSELGLELRTDKGLKVFLPTEHLGVEGLGPILLRTYQTGDELKDVMCVEDADVPIVSRREGNAFNALNLKVPTVQKLVTGMVFRASYYKHIDFGISFSIPVKYCRKKFTISSNKFVDEGVSTDVKFRPYKSLLVRALNINASVKKYKFSTKLSDVYNFDYKYSIEFLSSYLTDLDYLRARLIEKQHPIGDLQIGKRVRCVVNKFDANRGCSVQILPQKLQALVHIAHCPDDVKSGDELNGVVIAINYDLNYAVLALKEEILDKIKKKQDGKINEELIGSTCFAEILYANEVYAVAVLRNVEGKKQFVYLPVRLHENDYFPRVDYYKNLLGVKIKIFLCKKSGDRLFGVEKSMKKMLTKKMRATKPQVTYTKTGFVEVNGGIRRVLSEKELKTRRKRLISEEDEGIESDKSNKNDDDVVMEGEIKDELDEVKEETDDESDSEKIVGEDVVMEDKANAEDETNSDDETNAGDETNSEEETNSEDESNLEDESDLKEAVKKPQVAKAAKVVNLDSSDSEEEDAIAPVLPGMKSFFSPLPTEDAAKKRAAEDSSSDDEENEEASKKKKKRLTTAERTEAAKNEEKRLRAIESELADAASCPQSAEHFDRVLLGDPENSELWLQYVAFHAQATEFDKARAVAKKALEAIPYTATQPRLNLWLAYLNLENMYGTKETFEKVFEEASRSNDTLTIYLEAIRMLAEMEKTSEMDEKIKKLRGKFKQELKMWLEVGKIYYKCKRFNEARKLKDIALLTLQDKKTHVNLLVQYAIMEFSEGERNHGEALFETMLQSDPKRVDIWCTYIDQLVKCEQIDLARNVLNRAVGQRLSYKKMRTLFKKYHTFEQTYGDDETQTHVKQLLQEYTDTTTT